jgi:hypothetical protein
MRSFRLGCVFVDHSDELPYGAMGFQRMPQRAVCVNRVLIATSIAAPFYNTDVLKIADDFMHGAFGDADIVGNLTESHTVVVGETHENVSMVR